MAGLNLVTYWKTKRIKRAIDWEAGLPTHIAIMMDGNGRWATRRGLPRTAGHFAGMKTMRDIIRVCAGIRLNVLTLYAFSTENWKRPAEEVNFIIGLVHEFVNERTMAELNANGVKLHFIGDLSKFSDDVRRIMNDAALATRGNTGMTVNFAMNYGGRSEILHAARTLIAKGSDAWTEEEMEKCLYTADCPYPELIIRTSGEKRLSGFLLWQCADAELWFTDEMWPSFNAYLLYKALRDYQTRKGRT